MTNQTAKQIMANKAVEELAVLCGVRKSEMLSFLACLDIWTSKGYTLEAAIEKNMEQMTRFANNPLKLADTLKPLAVEWFYPEAA